MSASLMRVVFVAPEYREPIATEVCPVCSGRGMHKGGMCETCHGGGRSLDYYPGGIRWVRSHG